ncbi:Protein kinase domain [Arabidopsis suecica]|uniref:Protein kinase domain n=1 Tax=Arabidopsis suecica TaxID=45249 RepID=A0A8T1ZET9_ARASU|nr:Protein kinase domain [Arabidopsis suecica]
MEFPHRISFRQIDLSEAAPSSTNLDITELTRFDSSETEVIPSESNKIENLAPNEDISVSTSSSMTRSLFIDRILARMKKSPGRRGDKTSPVRRLDRRDALRNIRYDAGEDSFGSTSSLLMTRSLDFPNRTSFRVGGIDEGEMDRIYRYFDVSGPEDFAISSDAWKKAGKERSSSDVVNRLKSLDIDCHEVQSQGLSEAGPSGAVASSSTNYQVQAQDLSEAGPSGVVVSSNSREFGNFIELMPFESNKIENLSTLTDKVVVDGGTVENKRKPSILVESRGYLVPNDVVAVGGGIKGVRPPVLNVTPADKEVVDGGMVENKSGIERKPAILVKSKGYLVPNDAVVVGGGIKVIPPVLNLPQENKEVVDGGTVENRSGIKGVKPSVLKPPPVMKLPPVDLPGSSWDILTHFAPDNETVRRPSSSSSSENGCDEEEAGDEKVETEETGDMFIQVDDTTDEACSFTTNECDSSSSVSNTSPIYVSGGSINTSWQKGQLLRRGSFGSVYEAISEDGLFFAVEEVSLLDQGSQAQECIQQLEGEIALLSQLEHRNILRYRGTDKDGSNLYIFLDLVTQGSLLKLYQRYQLRESVVSLYTKQILDGLKYLHDKGFIHRDIKCANILVDANGAVKLADFGLAKVSKLNDSKSCKGTPFWMAPEVINPKGNDDGYGSPADIWSLGCTVLEMCTGHIPYFGLTPVQAQIRIERGTLPDIPDTLSLDARDFIVTCLKVNPEERPTAAELLNHPFVRRPLPSSGSGSASPLIRR